MKMIIMNEELSFSNNLDHMLFANIKIPIIVNDKNDIEYLNEYAHIFFEKCKELPKKQLHPVDIDFSQFFERAGIIKEEEKKENRLDENNKQINNVQLTVSTNEMKCRKRAINHSFKNKSAKASNFTKKNIHYDNDGL